MSIVIGYWSPGEKDELPDKLHRLLTGALARVVSNGLKIRRSKGHHSPSTPHSIEPSGPVNFSIAVCGRHTTLQTAVGSEAGGATDLSLKATLAASGAGSAPDVWIKASRRQLILGRGAFGRATIFWTQTDEAVWFASRIALLLSVVERAKLSTAGFYAYGCFSYTPAPLTPVENIHAVPAGIEMIWDGAASETTPQHLARHEWREAAPQITNEKESAPVLRRLLEESVGEQLARTSNESVGVLLSGGLDSSVTAALLVRAGARVRAYTLDFGKDCFSEAPYAELVARALGIPLTKIPVTPNCMRRMLDSTAVRLDGLYGDGVTIPLDLLCERARQEVSVIFNGEGGDQLFAGWTNKPLIAASLYEQTANATFTPSTAQAEEEAAAFAARYMQTFHRLYGHERVVYTEALRRDVDGFKPAALLEGALDPAYTNGLLHRLRRANLLLKGADNIQPRATNLGLSYDLDVRTLFCSRRLAEWTFGVSGELWLREGCEKYLLKRAVEDLLPSEIVWREKRGMGVPLTLWLKGRLRRWSHRRLHPRVLEGEGLWEADAARRISSGELSGQVQGRRIGETLWLMLMWRAWRESVFESHSEAATENLYASRRLSLPSLSALRRRYT
ncbi:MAG TPA: asparagine synthetase B family protein [Pyrinomonadaceae bacterium]|jgi:asparagine synthase (glutamine-hydrolysing)